MNGYLIPANSKKSMMIFGVFNMNDLILVGCGLGVSLVLLLMLPLDNIGIAIGAISPGLICGFLVFPMPNYHNMMTIISEAYRFYTTRQKFVWKGWCFQNGEDKK